MAGRSMFPTRTYRDEAVVLRTHKLGEADRIVVLLTRAHGQVRAVAKGVRRTSSRFGARLEPFMVVDAQLTVGRSLDVVTQVESLGAYAQPIASDYGLYTRATVMAETAERLTTADTGSATQQFLLLVGALGALNAGTHPPGLILDAYLLRALATAGWAPSFEDCARCGAAGPHDSVNIPLGGVVCAACRPPGSSSPLPGTVALLAGLLSSRWGVVMASGEQERAEAHALVAAYAQWHLERNLKSLNFME